jgi:hypothetical protein
VRLGDPNDGLSRAASAPRQHPSPSYDLDARDARRWHVGPQKVLLRVAVVMDGGELHVHVAEHSALTIASE